MMSCQKINFMENIIEIKNLGKKYNITHQRGGYIALRDVLTNIFKNPFQFVKHKTKQIIGLETKEEFWALKDINLEIQKGEVIGIIGHNGAGKSTLLKILSQITPPTTGEIRINGRVGSLLEVGTGFHPELTGRENIMLNGAILGMKKQEIIKKFDAIVEFAGIEKFLDTPVKYYSSGMYVRLAFSVAAHMEPDILIVDEVLAVGDAEFQKKCLGKMGAITKGEGKTILLVSHNLSSIQNLCTKCILLNKGKLKLFDSTSKAIELYLQDTFDSSTFPVIADNLIIHNYQILQNNIDTDYIDNNHPIKIKIDFSLTKDLRRFRFGVIVKNYLGMVVFRSFLSDWDINYDNMDQGKYGVTLDIPEKLLMPGNYIFCLLGGVINVADYLHKKNVQRNITVSELTEYNKAQKGEIFESAILLKSKWIVNKKI